jgi:hypothetical protein
MKATITIEGEVSAENLQLLAGLFGQGAVKNTAAPVKQIAAKAEDTSKQTSNATGEGENGVISMEMVRELATEKGTTNKAGVKALLIEFGAAKISTPN